MTGIWHWLGESSAQFTALAAIATGIFAFLGLRAWRQQLKGTAEYSLAKEALKAVFRVRGAFRHVRNPFVFGYEYTEEMLGWDGHVKPGMEGVGYQHVYESRKKVLNDAFLILEDKMLDSEVEWDSSYGKRLEPLRLCRAELVTTLQSFIRVRMPNFQAGSSTAATRARQDGIMYYVGEKEGDQTFNNELATAIAGLEALLRAHIDKGK